MKTKDLSNFKESRVGRRPVQIPAGVTVEIKDNKVIAKGKTGTLEQVFSPETLSIEQVDNTLQFKPKVATIQARADQGLYRALIQNIVTGVSEGFQKTLIVRGLGYRATNEGNDVKLLLGYSHPILFKLPQGVTVEVGKQSGKEFPMTVKGNDKQVVGQVAADIRNLRRPDAYKGAGVRYETEILKLKVGKKTGS